MSVHPRFISADSRSAGRMGYFAGYGLCDSRSVAVCLKKGDMSFKMSPGASCKEALEYYEDACKEYGSGKGCFDAAPEAFASPWTSLCRLLSPFSVSLPVFLLLFLPLFAPR